MQNQSLLTRVRIIGAAALSAAIEIAFNALAILGATTPLATLAWEVGL